MYIYIIYTLYRSILLTFTPTRFCCCCYLYRSLYNVRFWIKLYKIWKLIISKCKLQPHIKDGKGNPLIVPVFLGEAWTNFHGRLNGLQQGETVRVNLWKQEVCVYQSLLPTQVIKSEFSVYLNVLAKAIWPAPN